MAGKLSSQAQVRMAALQAMADKVQHVHGLTERFATERDARRAEMLALPLKRAFGRLKLDLMGAGLDTLSQLAGSMEIAAGRGASQRRKARILREGVGSMRFQIEQEQRRVVSEDEAVRKRHEPEESERSARARNEGPAQPTPGGPQAQGG